MTSLNGTLSVGATGCVVVVGGTIVVVVAGRTVEVVVALGATVVVVVAVTGGVVRVAFAVIALGVPPPPHAARPTAAITTRMALRTS